MQIQKARQTELVRDTGKVQGPRVPQHRARTPPTSSRLSLHLVCVKYIKVDAPAPLSHHSHAESRGMLVDRHHPHRETEWATGRHPTGHPAADENKKK